jgi:hypothetical protein
LKVIEAGLYEGFEALFVERHARGDEIHVEAGGARGADQFEDVGAGERFASGEIGLQDAQSGGFLEHAGPVFGGEFCGALREFLRIRAVDAVQRATVRKLSD